MGDKGSGSTERIDRPCKEEDNDDDDDDDDDDDGDDTTIMMIAIVNFDDGHNKPRRVWSEWGSASCLLFPPATGGGDHHDHDHYDHLHHLHHHYDH